MLNELGSNLKWVKNSRMFLFNLKQNFQQIEAKRLSLTPWYQCHGGVRIVKLTVQIFPPAWNHIRKYVSVLQYSIDSWRQQTGVKISGRCSLKKCKAFSIKLIWLVSYMVVTIQVAVGKFTTGYGDKFLPTFTQVKIVGNFLTRQSWSTW